MRLFDNRELAVLIWLGVGVVLLLCFRRTRSSLAQLGLAFAQAKLVYLVWLPMIVYVDGLLFVMGIVGLWNSDLVSETLFWLFGPAAVLLSRVDKADQDPQFVRRGLLSILEVTVAVEFFINLFPLNLGGELVLVPVLFFLGATLAVATLKPEYHSARVLLESLLILIALGLLGYGIFRIAWDLEVFATLGNLREFVVPILLTMAFAPFVYLLAVYFTYGKLFGILNFKLGGNKELERYAKWRLIRATFGRLKALRRFNKFPWRLTASMDRDAVDRAIERFRSGDTSAGY